jgi:hypothetical protein
MALFERATPVSVKTWMSSCLEMSAPLKWAI